MTTKTIKPKKVFEDSNSFTFLIRSSWNSSNSTKTFKSIACQTSPELYEVQDMDIQSGRYTNILQNQVSEEDNNKLLGDYLAKKYPKYSKDYFVNQVNNGYVSVDLDVITDPQFTLETDSYIEFVNSNSNAMCQTDSLINSIYDNSNESKFEDDFHELQSNKMLTFSKANSAKLGSFLDSKVPMMEKFLKDNAKSDSFDKLSQITSRSASNNYEAKKIKVLKTDFEKHKILYPDWSNNSKHYPATITKCIVTRNKERVYDIEYEDGLRSTFVREDYIRCLTDPSVSKISAGNSGTAIQNKLREGIKVHAKLITKNNVKFLPGRIVKVYRGNNSLYDVECEGSKTMTGLTCNDLIIGLQEKYSVEARKPQKVSLQSSSVIWNNSGNSVTISFGKLDTYGWCNLPGAITSFNIFSGENKNSSSINIPNYLFDHASCLMSVAYHPVVPSILAAGSINGEILIWDLNVLDASGGATTITGSPMLSSPIIEYAHKGSIVGLKWVYNPNRSSNSTSTSDYSTDSSNILAVSEDWLLASISNDGRVLFWSLQNKLIHPVKGYTVFKTKGISRR